MWVAYGKHGISIRAFEGLGHFVNRGSHSQTVAINIQSVPTDLPAPSSEEAFVFLNKF